jgi:hypothetical protein
MYVPRGNHDDIGPLQRRRQGYTQLVYEGADQPLHIDLVAAVPALLRVQRDHAGQFGDRGGGGAEGGENRIKGK